MMRSVISVAVFLVTLAKLTAPASAYTGCNIVENYAPSYGACQNPGNAQDVCDNGECRGVSLERQLWRLGMGFDLLCRYELGLLGPGGCPNQ